MALNGRSLGPPAAGSAPPAVHRRASPPPSTAAVTLDRPRPDADRAANLYSRAPDTRRRPEAERPAWRARPAAPKRSQHGERGERGERCRGEKPSAAEARLREATAEKRPVREQPAPLKPGAAGDADTVSEPVDSIVCPVCGRCRCEACREPRPLPQRLLCGRTCLLSADTCVDFTSCMCCVKAAAYHCAATDSGSRSADRPCGCGPPGAACALRWSALVLLSALVPCLCCYRPLRAAARLAQACYSRGEGCECPPPEPRRSPPVADPPRLRAT